jgi:hypothetical protein
MPDKVFSLGGADGGAPVHFFLEADRATMPVIRQGHLDRTSIYKKLLGYYETWKQDHHRTLFGFDRFLVIIVTTSEQRIQNMRDAAKKVNGGAGSRMFLFIDEKTLQSSPDILTAPFWNGRDGAPVRLNDLVCPAPGRLTT